jgi:hypothetical protein
VRDHNKRLGHVKAKKGFHACRGLALGGGEAAVWEKTKCLRKLGSRRRSSVETIPFTNAWTRRMCPFVHGFPVAVWSAEPDFFCFCKQFTGQVWLQQLNFPNSPYRENSPQGQSFA